MQIIRINIDNHCNFHCPITGQAILSEEAIKPSAATAAIWSLEVPEEPYHINEAVASLWDAAVEAHNAKFPEGDEDDDYENLEVLDFLEGIESELPQHVAFAISSTGPMMETMVIVIDMNYQD
jgi:hypothetical protein